MTKQSFSYMDPTERAMAMCRAAVARGRAEGRECRPGSYGFSIGPVSPSTPHGALSYTSRACLLAMLAGPSLVGKDASWDLGQAIRRQTEKLFQVSTTAVHAIEFGFESVRSEKQGVSITAIGLNVPKAQIESWWRLGHTLQAEFCADITG